MSTGYQGCVETAWRECVICVENRPLEAIPVKSRLRTDVLRRTFYVSMPSGMRGIKRIQSLRQRLGVFFIYHMAGLFDDLQFRALNILGQEAG